MQQNLASIGHSGVDNEPLPRLSRSPHPYARRALTESLRLDISDTTTPSQSESCQAQVKTDRRTHAVGGPRASPEVSSSDVEEDKVLQLKALPPTPVRPRKGLRVPIKANDYDVSPLLTPSALHEEEEKLARGYFTEATGDAALSKDDIDRARARFQARRRGELLRRGCEVLLVAVIAVVVLCGQGVWDCVKQCSRGTEKATVLLYTVADMVIRLDYGSEHLVMSAGTISSTLGVATNPAGREVQDGRDTNTLGFRPGANAVSSAYPDPRSSVCCFWGCRNSQAQHHSWTLFTTGQAYTSPRFQ